MYRSKHLLQAINCFKRVGVGYEKYADASKKISEVTKLYIEQMVAKAKEAASQKDYQAALNYLEKGLKYATNDEATKLH